MITPCCIATEITSYRCTYICQLHSIQFYSQLLFEPIDSLSQSLCVYTSRPHLLAFCSCPTHPLFELFKARVEMDGNRLHSSATFFRPQQTLGQATNKKHKEA